MATTHHFIFSPKRGYMEDFLRIVEKTGGMENYEEVDRIYLKKDSGEAYFIKKNCCFERSENQQENCFLIGWKGSLET